MLDKVGSRFYICSCISGMFKRLIIPLFFLILISLLSVIFCHNSFITHCPFCTKNAVNFEFIAEIVEEFSADDYNSQLDSIEVQVLIPLIAQNYFSVRAPPV